MIEVSSLIELGLPASIVVIMVGLGLSLTVADFERIVFHPQALVAGAMAQILIVPLLAFLLVSAMELPSTLAVGCIVIAACPGGTVSNVYTFLARGTLALSIALTVISSIVTVAVLPFFTGLALDHFAAGISEGPVRLPFWRTVGYLLAVILLPVGLGMFIRRHAPYCAVRAEAVTGLIGLVLGFVIIGGILYQVSDRLGELFAAAGPFAIALNAIGVACGLLCGFIPGVSSRDAMTVAIELGIKNGTLGLMVTLSMLSSEPMAMPSAVYGLLMFIFGAFIVVYGRWRYA